MRSANQVDVKFCQIVLDYILSEGIAYVSLIFSPALDVRVGIRPEDVAQHSLFRYLDGSLDVCKLVEIFEVRGKSPVHTEDLFVHESSDGHHVEHVNEILPYFQVVFTFACVIISVHSS